MDTKVKNTGVKKAGVKKANVKKADFSKFGQPKNLGEPKPGWSSDPIAEVIRSLDYKFVAMVPGSSFRGLHDSIVNYLGNDNPKMLLTLHEEHCVAIAHGYAKVTDEPMAVALHTNVGLMHACMAIHNAWCDRKPIVIFGANGPQDADKRRPWIDWIHSTADQAAIIRDYTKWDDSPFSVPAALESVIRADQIARTPPYGPTYVCLDCELQQEPLKSETKLPDVTRYQHPKPAAPAPADIAEAADLLLAAKRPLILAGRTSRDQAGWDQRIALAEALGALVQTDLHWSASFPSDHPLHVLEPRFRVRPTDPHIQAFKEADVVLSLDWIDLGGHIKRAGGLGNVTGKIIHASVDSYSHRGWSKDHHILPAADLRIQATPEMVTAALLEEFAKRGVRKAGGVKLNIARGAPEQAEPAASGEMGLRDMALIWKAFRNTRDDISMISIPLGWPGDCVDIFTPMDYFGNNGGAGIGAGPGIAVGVALALAGTGRIPVALVGDGDFLMGASAIWSASHFELPLMIVIANNRSYYNDEAHQERLAVTRKRPVENKWIGLQIRGPEVDLVGLSKSYGFEASTVADAADLRVGFEEAAKVVANGGRYVLDVRVRPGYSD